MSFVNGELIPYLRTLKNKPGATPRQKVISEVFSSIDKTGIDTERNLLDILDKIHKLNVELGMRNKDILQSTIKIPQSSWRSWRVPIEEIKAKDYDLKAVNPNRKDREDSRAPEELIAIIESQATEITKALNTLRNNGI